MSLSNRLKQLKPQRGPTECITCDWLSRQSKEDRAAFSEWVDNGWSPTQLRKNCQAEGLTASETSFARHINNHEGRP